MNIGRLRWGASYSALIWALAVGAPEPGAAAPRETVLYSFTDGPDGAYPLSDLVISRGGALLGTTSEGGDLDACDGKGCGVVFALTPPASGGTEWKETILYEFEGGSDGATPRAGVLMDQTGALYGTTSEGGGGQCYSYKAVHRGSVQYWKKEGRAGCGTVFELTPPGTGHPLWSETVLYRFQGKDGRFAASIPLMDKTGALYGVTGEGGAGPCGYFMRTLSSYGSSSYRLQYRTGCGTAFKLTPPAAHSDAWTLTTLHEFESKPDGAFPNGGVIFAADGSLIGTTNGGNLGEVGTYTSNAHSSYHYGLGTVFQLTPPAPGHTVWTQSILYAFESGGGDGITPLGTLVRARAGALFGAAAAGGTGNASAGLAFRLSPPAAGNERWTKTTLYTFRFGRKGGAVPSAGLIGDVASGALYGVAGQGGTGCKGFGCGTVFSLEPPAAGKKTWTETPLHLFGSTLNDGQNPQARLARDKAGNLYGTTAAGGTHLYYGTVFKVSP